MLDLIKIVADELGLSKNSVENTVKLLDEDSTVPFIARYRKEVTGSLDEEQIRNIEEKINYLRNLEKRKEEVIRLIEEQGKLTDELKLAISTSVKLQEVEDLYLPYKRKKKTKIPLCCIILQSCRMTAPDYSKFHLQTPFELCRNCMKKRWSHIQGRMQGFFPLQSQRKSIKISEECRIFSR